MRTFNVGALIRKVDLLTLKIFLAVVEEGQLARAASREHIVPSAVTKRIQELEELIGIKLFHRANKGTALTPAGHVVAKHIHMIFDGIDRMRDEIGEFVNGPRGRVRVCANEAIIIDFVADEIFRFGQEYPDIEVDLLLQQQHGMFQQFAVGKVDIGIFASYGAGSVPTIRGAKIIKYRTDQLVALAPRGHQLTMQPNYDLKALVESGLIGWRPTSPLMIHLQKVSEVEGISLRLKYEVTTNEVARALVRAGLGVSIQPEGALDLEDYERVTLLPLKQEWATRHLYMVSQSRRPLTAAASTFVAHIARSAGQFSETPPRAKSRLLAASERHFNGRPSYLAPAFLAIKAT